MPIFPPGCSVLRSYERLSLFEFLTNVTLQQPPPEVIRRRSLSNCTADA